MLARKGLHLGADNKNISTPKIYRYRELNQAPVVFYSHWRIYIVKLWTPPPPPGRPNSFNFMQFLGEFGKIVYSPPPPEGLRPHLGEILDTPLIGMRP